jgi:hypothetical protein
MKILHLTLTKKWFDLIASGEKKEEYREIKPYWNRRFFDFVSYHSGEAGSIYRKYDVVRFKNGYAKDAPTMDVEYDGMTITGGIVEWGAEPHETYYVLRLGKVLSISNYQTETA